MVRRSIGRDGNPPIAERAGEVDAETLYMVQAFLVARMNRRACESHLVDAWDRFFSACDPLIRKLASDRRARAADHQDRAQEVWRVLLARLGQYDPLRGSVHAWLRTVIRHALIDQERSHRSILCLEPLDAGDIPGGDPGPASHWEVKRRREHVLAAMKKLRDRVPELSYQVVHDHWIEGRSFGDIALALGISPKQVRDRHYRTFPKLRDLLARECRGSI